jgi:cation diffusion facilitator CzcD-associated flavoprotein CzcO
MALEEPVVSTPLDPREAHVDVLIIGAGLSGIGAAAHLTRTLPHTSYAVLEARAVSGGTWDLFRYPGIRSDSDMYTMGYRFKPWLDEESLGFGDRILAYLRETAREYDVEQHIRYDHRVVRASWDTATARWTVETRHAGETATFTAGFLWSCRGYYDYEHGHEPEFAGADEFRGPIVHPQQWPDDLDWSGKKVVVIGSGATAVTLVPAMAPDAAHVTMLQRSPSYVMSLAGRDPVALALRRRLPARTANRVIRWKNILTTAAFYRISRRRPAFVRRLVRKQNVALLPEGYDVDTHFTPRYDPWDQRMCFVPDADLFKAVRRGDAEVVTSTIERFDESGIVLTGGRHLDADVIVTATGLRLSAFGEIELVVDGVTVDPSNAMAYRALMLSGVPNFVFTVGYTNASWTLKVDLVAEFTCRVLSHMAARGYRSVVPVRDASVGELPFMDFTSGYVLRGLDQLPRQGDREPWRLRQSYLRDRRTIRTATLEDGVLRFT